MPRTDATGIKVQINGSPIPQIMMSLCMEMTVERSLNLPDSCLLRFLDERFEFADGTLLKEGNDLIIEVTSDDGESGTIFHGEITGLDLDMAAGDLTTTLVRGMDRSHLLHRGRFQETYLQMTDSDIVTKVAQKVGLTASTDPTQEVHPWIVQKNQTHWEFLSERAMRSGCRLYVDGKRTLHFKKVADAANAIASLTWSEDLLSFRPRTAASHQVESVEVRGWDPKEKKAISGLKSKAKGLPSTDAAPDKHSFSKAKMVVVDRPVHTAREAEMIAQSLLDEISGSYLEAEGMCLGAPKLAPGEWVEVKGVGKRFSGKYFLTSVTHIYSGAEGYTTLFSCNGKRSNSILGMVGGGQDSGAASFDRNEMGGNIVVALVTALDDPKNEGRIKVKYPWLTEQHESFWARIASPMAGKGRGFYYLPEIDDEVLVAFEQGDMTRPYVLGALWNGKDEPPEGNDVAVKESKVQRRTVKTRIGHTMLFDDTDDKGEMSLTTKAINRMCLDDKNQNVTLITTNKHTLVLDDKNKSILAKTTDGHQVLLDDAGGKIVVVDKTGNNKITITSSSNAMQLECVGDFSVDSKGKVSIKGVNGISLETPQNVKVDGMQVDVAAKTNLTMQANMNASLKASMKTEIEGTMQAELKGGLECSISAVLVKIN